MPVHEKGMTEVQRRAGRCGVFFDDPEEGRMMCVQPLGHDDGIHEEGVLVGNSAEFEERFGAPMTIGRHGGIYSITAAPLSRLERLREWAALRLAPWLRDDDEED